MKIAKRLATAAISLWATSFLAFVVGAAAPGDPARMRVGLTGDAAPNTDFEKRYLAARRELDLDLPLFYLSVVPASFPDTFERVVFDRRSLVCWLWQFGDWDGVWNYYRAVKNTPVQNDEDLYLQKALLSPNPAIETAIARGRFFDAVAAWNDLKRNAKRWRNFVPKIYFHGFRCRYHRWLTGRTPSFRDFRPVGEKLREAFVRTLIPASAALFLGCALGLATAIRTVGRPRRYARVQSLCLGLYSLPTFWTATILTTVLAGGVWSVLPTHGWRSTGITPEASLWTQTTDVATHLILPIVCLTYPIWAFWTLQFQENLRQEWSRPYVLAARAWGMDDKRILVPMTLKNAAAPAVALAAASLPAVLAGSMVVETFFALPGMGLLAYESVIYRDYPVLSAVFTLSAAVAQTANLLADLMIKKILVDSKIV
ncbi:MAG: ABC transporter permease [Bacteroidia bacterium]|nr:ABC transporter permease [Bacteroidia bacterium]MDW8333963.1 ABC transporter permease [Bacteroidia bacterium]